MAFSYFQGVEKYIVKIVKIYSENLDEDKFWNEMDVLGTILADVNPLSANPTKWSNTLKEFVDKI